MCASLSVCGTTLRVVRCWEKLGAEGQPIRQVDSKFDTIDSTSTPPPIAMPPEPNYGISLQYAVCVTTATAPASQQYFEFAMGLRFGVLRAKVVHGRTLSWPGTRQPARSAEPCHRACQ